MPDPILSAVALHADALMQRVAAGEANPHDALAVLIADTLGVAVEAGVPPETSRELLNMCGTWALNRRHALQAEGLLRHDPMPDNPGELLESNGDGE